MYRGHKIEKNNNVYIYSDTKQPVPDNINRECGHCGLENTKEGHDGCLGTLPGIMNACCGHGKTNETYIQLLNGRTVKGHNARLIIDILKE